MKSDPGQIDEVLKELENATESWLKKESKIKKLLS
jgi:hypothetical protein